MKTYHLTIMGGGTPWTEQVQAAYFHTTTNNSTTSGYYGFYDDEDQTVACYPINRTIISKIEDNK